MHRERFPCHWLQWKPLVNDPGMHHGTCVTHVSWCISGSLISVGGKNVPGTPGACTTRNFTYLARGPLFFSCDHPGTKCGLVEKCKCCSEGLGKGGVYLEIHLSSWSPLYMFSYNEYSHFQNIRWLEFWWGNIHKIRLWGARLWPKVTVKVSPCWIDFVKTYISIRILQHLSTLKWHW